MKCHKCGRVGHMMKDCKVRVSPGRSNSRPGQGQQSPQKRFSPSPRQSGYTQKPICQICNKPGHNASTCYQRNIGQGRPMQYQGNNRSSHTMTRPPPYTGPPAQATVPSPARNVQYVTCYLCKQKGHFKNQCPNNQNKTPINTIVRWDPDRNETRAYPIQMVRKIQQVEQKQLGKTTIVEMEATSNMYIQLLLHGINVKGVLDTGAQGMNIIPLGIWDKIKERAKTENIDLQQTKLLMQDKTI